MLRKRIGILCVGIAACILPAITYAHGFVGKRFFPTTLSINNPFVNDELGLKIFRAPAHVTHPLTRHARRTGLTRTSINFSKRLTRRLQFSVSDSYALSTPRGANQRKGMGNVVLGLRLQGPVRADDESTVSLGLNVDIGGTGSDAINHNSYTTLSPTFNFAQGFGNLPAAVKYLRPLALTGSIAWNYPTRSHTPQTLATGFAIQYSLPYLQSISSNATLPVFIRNVIPIVEFPFTVCLDNGCGGTLAGSVNPGVIWATRYGQIGMEAMIPVDSNSGTGVGGVLELRAYFSQLFPHTLGKPIFGPLFNQAISG